MSHLTLPQLSAIRAIVTVAHPHHPAVGWLDQEIERLRALEPEEKEAD